MSERNTNVHPILRSIVNVMSPKVEPVKPQAIELLHSVDNLLAAALKDPLNMEARVMTAKYKLMRALALLDKQEDNI